LNCIDQATAAFGLNLRDIKIVTITNCIVCIKRILFELH